MLKQKTPSPLFVRAKRAYNKSHAKFNKKDLNKNEQDYLKYF
jgi:hypothetical protein